MLPLRWKLVGLYALVLAAVIVAFGVALVVGWRGSLLRAMDGELEARAGAVCALAERERDGWFVEKKSGLGEDFAEASGRYYLVADLGGNVLIESPLVSKLALTAPGADGVRGRPAGRGRYRELTITLTKAADEEEGVGEAVVRVTCGADVSGVDASVAALTRLLLAVGPAVLLLSLAGGFLLVSRALRPIERMAQTAEQISALDLTRRVEVQGDDELARLGRTLNEMFERLQAAFEQQTRFTADASHELRTPLSIISGNVELGLKRPRSAEEHREVLEDIREASDRMRSIVEGLLVLARADAKGLPLLREPVSLTAVADEIVRLFRPLAEERGVTVAVASAGDVTAIGDRDRFKDLISNLVTNAIRYNRRGGSVTVRLSTADGRASLSVDDTGIGIPAEDLPHVFERFYRVDKARSRSAGGSGLGLAIVKWIVDTHSGTIAASSEPGVGTRFVVSLPA